MNNLSPIFGITDAGGSDGQRKMSQIIAKTQMRSDIKPHEKKKKKSSKQKNEAFVTYF